MSISYATRLNFPDFDFNTRYAVKISSTGTASSLLIARSLLQYAFVKYCKGKIRFLPPNSFNGLQIVYPSSTRVMPMEESAICAV